MPGRKQPADDGPQAVRFGAPARRGLAALAGVLLAMVLLAPAATARPDDPQPIGGSAHGPVSGLAHALQHVLAHAPTMPAPSASAPIAEPPAAAMLFDHLQALLGAVSTGPTPGTSVSAPTVEPVVPAEVRARTIERPRLDPTGTRAVLALTRSSTALLALALAAATFLAFESVLGRRNPRVSAAPVDRRETELEFR